MALRSTQLHHLFSPSAAGALRGKENPAGSFCGCTSLAAMGKKTGATKKRASVVSAVMRVSMPVERSWVGRSWDGILGLPSSLEDVAAAAVRVLQRRAVERRYWAMHAQLFIEKAIMNSRFFTLPAVAGSLIGSIVCFLEGCSLIAGAFFRYFLTMPHHLDQGEIMNLVMEATGMFFMGSGMLNFGMAMYIMFVGTRGTKACGGTAISGLSNASSLLNQMMVRSSMGGSKWISHAKTRLGQGVVMMLQGEVVEKFKSVPMASGLDLVCFAGALLLAAASVGVLSKLHCSSRPSEEVSQ